ncbi:heme-degrading domain-containing protein, partial [Amaricoccus sp.]|uniref:heme-degrading domain-containing protein n=1 Tax=Amaricoccus sp. TaxID=1872485 RepID=UPI002631D7BF
MTAELVAAIAAQEARLVFDGFDADRALGIGLDIRERVAAAGKAVAIDLRLWDRRLFWFAMPGTTPDNEDWVRRKVNAVRRFQKSTFRLGLEKGGRLLPPEAGPEAVADCVLAGGGFPLKIRGVGCVGAVTVSGLPQREDHEVVVAALAAALGVPAAEVALPG